MASTESAVMMLHALTGNQLKILLALKILNVCAPVVQIAATAGLERHTVRAGLDSLAALGYAESVDRVRWQLASAFTQLPLWTPAQLDGRNSTIARADDDDDLTLTGPRSSSSSSGVERDGRKTTIAASDGRKTTIAAALAAELSEQTGCPLRRAVEAVAAALAAGDAPAVIRQEVVAWVAVRAVLEERGIKNFGYFVAKKIEDGESCDVRPTRSRDALDTVAGRKDYYIPAEYAHLIEH